MATKKKTKAVKEEEKVGRYFIVNPSGTIHEVNREHAQSRLRLPGWRQATLEEVQELNARGGNQRFDDPICEPWNPEPAPIEGLEFELEAVEVAGQSKAGQSKKEAVDVVSDQLELPVGE